MLKIRNFLCKLTQSVKKKCKFFFEFEKKNLLTAAKAPLCNEPKITFTLYLTAKPYHFTFILLSH